MFDAIGMGMLCVDLVTNIQKLPVSNETEYISEFSMQGGGLVPTAIAAASRLGASCALMGKLGRDYYGSFCVEDLEYHGVDVGHVVQVPGLTTSFSIVMSEYSTKERAILHYRGSARDISEADLDFPFISQGRRLYLSSSDPLSVKCAKYAKSHGIPVVFDGDKHRSWVADMLADIDVFIGSEFFYRGEFGEDKNYERNIRSFCEKGPPIAVFTFGSSGCRGVAGGRYFTQDIFPVNVKDTMGAGDVFHGAFLYGLIQKWDVPQIARFASAVAAIKCTVIGGRAGIPDRAMTDEFLSTGKFDPTPLEERVLHYRQRGGVHG